MRVRTPLFKILFLPKKEAGWHKTVRQLAHNCNKVWTQIRIVYTEIAKALERWVVVSWMNYSTKGTNQFNEWKCDMIPTSVTVLLEHFVTIEQNYFILLS